MANTKKQFMGMYDEAVDLLKKFKQSNDNLNKSIGVDHDSSISVKLREEQTSHSMMVKKLDGILQRLEQSYLDPDTARKIGTVKQQYKIQKDRRTHIQKSLTQLQENSHKMPQQTSQSKNYINYRGNNAKNHNLQQTRQQENEQKNSSSTAHTRNRQYEEQITEYDYQIECKLLQEKNKALQEAEKQMINVYNITKECNEMVQYQGEHIDMISDHICKAHQNTKSTVKQIKEANQHSKKRRKKIFTFSLLLIIAVLTLLAFLFF